MRALRVGRTSLNGVIVAALLMSAGGATAQSFPYKPVRIVVPGTGGGTDLMARLIAHELSVPLAQQVIVENRPTGVIPAETVSRAQADGYTLLMSGSGMWLAPLVQSKVPYDPVKDFSPVTLAVSQPNVLVVHPAVATSVKELIAAAKAKPGALNYASGSAGSANHVAAELFKAKAGVNIVRVNYKGIAAMVPALMSGEVQVLFGSAAAVIPQAKTGKIRALAVTSAKPSALLPDLPTVAASGLPGYESTSVYGIFAPAKTPRAVIARLNKDIVGVLSRADVRDKLISMGAEAAGSTPEQLAAAVKTDMTVVGKVIKDAGIQAE
jgi:tripartite-type tricarboxylate transporter receptor subunit TctC